MLLLYSNSEYIGTHGEQERRYDTPPPHTHVSLGMCVCGFLNVWPMGHAAVMRVQKPTGTVKDRLFNFSALQLYTRFFISLC